MNKHIDEIEFTIFDTETTGLEPELGDRVIEIAGIRFRREEVIATFESLVNPCREIPESSQNINHITTQMIESAPTMDKIMPSFLEFIKGSYLCAYNASFDLNFLQNELKILKMPPLLDTVVIDLLKMSKRLLPGLSRYALGAVAENLNIKIDSPHRALDDARTSFEIFRRLRKILLDKGIIELSNFLQLFALNDKYTEDLNNQKVSRIQEAIDLGVKLKIRYLSRKDAEVSEREVIPKEIKQEKQQYYLVGYCLLRNEERTFSLDGILHLEIL